MTTQITQRQIFEDRNITTENKFPKARAIQAYSADKLKVFRRWGREGIMMNIRAASKF